MKQLFLMVLIALFASSSFAQSDSPVYGQPSDLKGLKKIFINTGSDTKSRDSIIKDLGKSKFGFEIVDGADEAEIYLGFGADQVASVVWRTSVASRVLSQRTGDGVVRVRARGKVRLVLAFEDTQNTKWERKPVTNFVREFIKVYKKGNGL